MTTVRDPGAGTPLDTHLHAFVRTLRERGMAIGPGEAITAAEVLHLCESWATRLTAASPRRRARAGRGSTR